ncbi:MAG: ABC transporter permease, partial [Alsobacter sp.]
MDKLLIMLSWGDRGWLDELAAGALVTISLALATLPFGLALGL